MANRSYSLFIENNDGHLLGPPLMVQADNDDDAVAQAAKIIADGLYAELRDDMRLVKTFNDRK